MRARLIGMVVALLAVTLGAVAFMSTRVAHFELHKLEVHRLPAQGGMPPRIIVLRKAEDGARTTSSLDRSFFFIFAGATLFGVLMALLVARWISKPVERLTAAARRMEGGDLTVRVEPSGGAPLEELATSFNAMAAAIDRNEEVRRRMVTDVAHELRAPLTNLRCELESIQDGLTDASTERIASLHDEVMHLSALVEDLQDLSLADAGKLELDAQRVNVGEVVRRAARGMSIAMQGDDEVSVHADPRRVVQILTNLVSNASAAHATEIRIEWEVVDSEVAIRVIDNGIGIAEDQLPHIF
ncbi:MAG TPA: HAMP domain-containing protein, partial [Thermoanaerobaculia bacterium]